MRRLGVFSAPLGRDVPDTVLYWQRAFEHLATWAGAYLQDWWAALGLVAAWTAPFERIVSLAAPDVDQECMHKIVDGGLSLDFQERPFYRTALWEAGRKRQNSNFSNEAQRVLDGALFDALKAILQDHFPTVAIDEA
ncbi:unnamed protein product [Prorocentrum cordatum]|uniref:Uncharacterized protein n=1 Tax=Prorocentrum cordatum TaxID=2364126 RepID=A0ABN9UYF4_9DINO|nr:unnamed protein product [Polarella glacialis]